MLVLIARSAPPGVEVTIFAIMASLMNLALSASQLFTRYLNAAFGVTQTDYSDLGRLMVTVGLINLAPLAAPPVLRRYEVRGLGLGQGAEPTAGSEAGPPAVSPATRPPPS
jgi:hypothetical protein